MRKASLALVVLTLLTAPLLAQDWRKDAASTNSYNCDLVGALADEYGSESILQSDTGQVTALSEFLFSLFPECPSREETPAAETGAAEDRLAELIESEELESIRVLVENISLEWGDPACSIMVDDFNETDFTLLTGGHGLDGIAVDVYLPGETQPAEMDGALTDVTRSGLPIRQEWLDGDEFPLGDYLFEVHIDGETSHFVWRRADQAMNTFSLVCPDRAEGDAVDAASAPVMRGDDIEVTAVLNDNDVSSVADDFCTLIVTDQFESDLNVSLIDRAIEYSSVDVYLPGDAAAIAMPKSQTDEIEVYGETVLMRTLWVERDSFPLGRYTFDVHLLGETYRFEWMREDSAVNTIVLVCSDPAPDAEPDAQPDDVPETAPADDVHARLTDGEFLDLEGAGCYIATSNLESPFFSYAVSGSNHDDIELTVAYPGATSPIQMEQSETLVGEEGLPYRVAWVDEDSYPSGIYTITVTTPDHEFHFEWDRQDDAYRTIFFSCPPVEEVVEE